jgi:hypothetical protein
MHRATSNLDCLSVKLYWLRDIYFCTQIAKAALTMDVAAPTPQTAIFCYRPTEIRTTANTRDVFIV